MEMPHHAEEIASVLCKVGTWCHHSANNIPVPDNEFYREMMRCCSVPQRGLDIRAKNSNFHISGHKVLGTALLHECNLVLLH